MAAFIRVVRHTSYFILCVCAIGKSTAETIKPEPLLRQGDQQLIRQQQRQDALQQQLTPEPPDVRLASPTPDGSRLQFAKEHPCFLIKQVILDGQQTLPTWLSLPRLTRQAQGQCIGVKGVNQLMSALQNRIIGHGFITTRVLAPRQSLKQGILRLTILPGMIQAVRLTPGSDDRLMLFSAFPAHAGQRLDLRDIEQGLENLQRLPTVQAEMNIQPGDKPGQSIIAITRKQSRLWRLEASLDDSGSRATGRYQGGLTLSLDNPLSLSDLAYLSVSHDLQKGREKGTRNVTGYYSLPLGYWLLSVTGSDYHYHQTVSGLNGDYRYSGNSKMADLQVSRVLHRNATQKTSFSYDLLVRESGNAINRTNIDVQHRQTSAWRLGLQHRHYIGTATLDLSGSYQHGTRWFGAQPAPEEVMGDGTAIARIAQLSAQLTQPFTLMAQSWSYSLQYQRQITDDALTPQDQFAIGSRWSVRGFDGERSLNASRGWYLRNELSWITPLPNQALYLGIDYGEVGGKGKDQLVGTHLAGAVIGLRGQWLHTNYDLFAGTPLSRPEGFKTSKENLGFTLSWSY